MIYLVKTGQYSSVQTVGYSTDKNEAERFCALKNSEEFKEDRSDFPPYFQYYIEEVEELSNLETLHSVTAVYVYNVQVRVVNGKFELTPDFQCIITEEDVKDIHIKFTCGDFVDFNIKGICVKEQNESEVLKIASEVLTMNVGDLACCTSIKDIKSNMQYTEIEEAIWKCNVILDMNEWTDGTDFTEVVKCGVNYTIVDADKNEDFKIKMFRSSSDYEVSITNIVIDADCKTEANKILYEGICKLLAGYSRDSFFAELETINVSDIFPLNNIPEGFKLENGHIVMTDERMDEAFKYATEQAIVRAQLKGEPVAKWDNELQKAYLLYPDGRREYT